MDRQIKDLVHASRQWARARANARRTADSKKATEKEMDAAKAKLMEASEKLFRAVVVFENELKKPRDKKKKSIPIDWNKFFGAVAAGAQALESAVQPKGSNSMINAEVIDTYGEDVT